MTFFVVTFLVATLKSIFKKRLQSFSNESRATESLTLLPTEPPAERGQDGQD